MDTGVPEPDNVLESAGAVLCRINLLLEFSDD